MSENNETTEAMSSEPHAAAQPAIVGGAVGKDADFSVVRREVNLLGHALGHAIRTLSGQRLFELEENVRALTKALRRQRTHADEAALNQLVTELSLGEAEGLVRAFSTYLHLVNVAEERHRVRVNRALEAESSPQAPRRESLKALLGVLHARGLGFDEVVALLEGLELHLTFTAHPTETRRRSLRHQLSRVQAALDEASEEDVRAHVSLMWGTAELRHLRPTVEDEVQGGLFYLPSVLWNVVPRLVDGLEKAVEAQYGQRPRLGPPLVFRSWIGGDRDGNPNVTPNTTRWAQAFARETAVRGFVAEVDNLIQDLSVSDERLPVPTEVTSLIDRRTQDLPLPDRWSHEPFRRFGMSMRYRLRSLLGEQPGPSYESSAEFISDLAQTRMALDAMQLNEAARRAVRPLKLRAQAFGLDLVALDLREESRAHTEAVDELFKAAGVRDDYAKLSPAEREALLSRELTSARPLRPVGYRPKTRALEVALGALEAWQARGAYVVSMTHTPSDLLEVLVLAREVGLFTPGAATPFDVVPLFETLADLEAAPAVVRSLLENPTFLAQVQGRGGFELMIGYSDSNKDAGFLAANWALHRAQEGITAEAARFGVEVWFFHGRGTSTARGGGSAGRAIGSLPAHTVGRRLRITEQGEALADRYSKEELAYRHLEQLIFHLGCAAARDQAGDVPPLDPQWRQALDAAARLSTQAYRDLLAVPGFFEFYEQFTPIREIGALKIASRPVYRSGRVRDIKDLRAIPWVMSWTQVRLPVPSFFGLAEGLASIPLALRREMFQKWPFFASTLDSAGTAIAKGDVVNARSYLSLVDPALADRFFPLLEGAFEKARALLEETFERPLLGHHPALARQVELRNPYIDPISRMQVELLRRYRATEPGSAERDALEPTLMASLVGIAAGLRNAG